MEAADPRFDFGMQGPRALTVCAQQAEDPTLIENATEIDVTRLARRRAAGPIRYCLPR